MPAEANKAKRVEPSGSENRRALLDGAEAERLGVQPLGALLGATGPEADLLEADATRAAVDDRDAACQAGDVTELALGASDCEALHAGWLGQPVNALSSLAYVLAGAYVLRRGGLRASALALAATGVGSLLYHGPMPWGAGLAHDGSIAAVAVTIPFAWRRGVLGRPPPAALAIGAVAVVVNLLTRTEAPLCRPDSLLQGHAAWHMLTAAALALWFAPRDRPRSRESASPEQPLSGRA